MLQSCGTELTLCHHRSLTHRPPTLPAAPVRTVCNQRKRCAIATSAASRGYGNTAREPNYDSVSFRQESGASASTSSISGAIDVTDDSQKEDRMDEVKQFLKAELDRIFTNGVSSRSTYCLRLRNLPFQLH